MHSLQLVMCMVTTENHLGHTITNFSTPLNQSWEILEVIQLSCLLNELQVPEDVTGLLLKS